MKDLLQELKKRTVFDVVVIYVVTAWVLIQVADVVLPTFGAPGWVNQTIIFLSALGLPLVVTLRIFFDRTRGQFLTKGHVEGKSSISLGSRDEANKPSIAVLSFENLSKDEDKNFLAEGITEDVTTGLSFNPHLSVMSRHATLIYKNNPSDLRDVGKALGSRYLLEGSIRPVGDRIRVSVQLIESASGTHLWAGKYDRTMDKMLEEQDEVVAEIVGALDAQISTAEINRVSDRPTDNLGAWDLLQKTGLWTFTPTKEGFENSQKLSRMAIEKDPNYALAHATLAFALRGQAINGFTEDIAAAFEESTKHAILAIALAPNDPVCLRWVGCAHVYGTEIESGIHYLRRSLEKSPNDGITLMHLALGLGISGQFDEAYECLDRAGRVAPSGGLSIGYAWYQALILTWEGRYAQAEERIKNFLLHVPKYGGAHMFLGLVYARQGKLEMAKNSIEKGIALSPTIDFSKPPLFLTSVRAAEEEIRTKDLLKKVWPYQE